MLNLIIPCKTDCTSEEGLDSTMETDVLVLTVSPVDKNSVFQHGHSTYMNFYTEISVRPDLLDTSVINHGNLQ